MPFNKETQLASLKEQLMSDWDEDTQLYALFHSVEIDQLWFNLDFWELEHSSLLNGEEAEDLKTVCAYLVRLDPKHESFDVLLAEFGNNNSLYFSSSQSFETLLDKFQSLHHVYTEYGESALNLFYVPRIFRNYLVQPGCARRTKFLSGIRSYFCEGSMAYELEKFAWREDELQHTIHKVEGYKFDENILPNINTSVSFAGVRT